MGGISFALLGEARKRRFPNELRPDEPACDDIAFLARRSDRICFTPRKALSP
jgi:hypothetical protein